jgi:hypothetical protein
MEHLDEICSGAIALHGEQVRDLDTRITNLAQQLEYLRQFNELTDAITQDSPLPLRRLSYTLKLWEKEGHKERVSHMLQLNSEAVIFLIIALKSIFTMPESRFFQAFESVRPYLRVQNLRPGWYQIKQMKNAIANGLDQFRRWISPCGRSTC